jgi:hypothetical protein
MLLDAQNNRDVLFAAVNMQSHRLVGIPTLEKILRTPSASFKTLYERAKHLAIGEARCTSVVTVNLTHTHIFELAEKGRSQLYFSSAHVFVAAVGPEGVVIWQSWGKYGHGLDEYL